MASTVVERFNAFAAAAKANALSQAGKEQFARFFISNVQTLREEVPDFQAVCKEIADSMESQCG